jgi:MinD-like ATPase involved in chromosome partitioning or flagellar assembly
MIVALWGSSGSGKSSLSVQIALALSRKKHNVVLVDTNFVVPQCGIWFPDMAATQQHSLSTILENEITPEGLAGRIHLVNRRLGVLGYTMGELAMNSLIQRYDTAASLLHIAATLSDYVIVDCQTNITQDHLTFTALEMSGRKIIIHTPDMRGISFRLSNVTMLADSKYNMENAIQVLNKVRTISPVDSIERVIGNINYTLPFDHRVYRALCEGESGKLSGYDMSKPYSRVFDSLINNITSDK